MKIVHYVLGISWWRYIAAEQDPHNMFSFLDELSTINARSSGSIALPKAVLFLFHQLCNNCPHRRRSSKINFELLIVPLEPLKPQYRLLIGYYTSRRIPEFRHAPYSKF